MTRAHRVKILPIKSFELDRHLIADRSVIIVGGLKTFTLPTFQLTICIVGQSVVLCQALNLSRQPAVGRQQQQQNTFQVF